MAAAVPRQFACYAVRARALPAPEPSGDCYQTVVIRAQGTHRDPRTVDELCCLPAAGASGAVGAVFTGIRYAEYLHPYMKMCPY